MSTKIGVIVGRFQVDNLETLDHRINYLKSLEEIPQDSEIYICGSRDSVAERYKENEDSII